MDIVVTPEGLEVQAGRARELEEAVLACERALWDYLCGPQPQQSAIETARQIHESERLASLAAGGWTGGWNSPVLHLRLHLYFPFGLRL